MTQSRLQTLTDADSAGVFYIAIAANIFDEACLLVFYEARKLNGCAETNNHL